MSHTLALRERFVDIARTNVGRVEDSKNQADWIKPLWLATDTPNAWKERWAYCATGVAWTMKEWLKLPEVLAALKMTAAQAEKWRCDSASCFKAGATSWLGWAEKHGYLMPLGNINEFVFHTADLIIYKFSHIEIFSGDLEDGRFMAVGYNTNAAGSRDGDRCSEKPRSRREIKAVIRFLK